jgi:hypothetical protein
MTDHEPSLDDLTACGYLLPPDPIAVLDINYPLLTETLRMDGLDQDSGTSTESRVLAD